MALCHSWSCKRFVSQCQRSSPFSSCSPGPARPVCTPARPQGRALAQQENKSAHRATRRTLLAPLRAVDGASSDYDSPDTAKEAIELGRTLCEQQRWQEALGIFEKAMTLPGTGTKRFRDKPKLLSDGEKMAVNFNIACCHSNLGDVRAGLVALSSCLELGYSNFKQVRSDPDLAALRADPRFEGLMQRFEPKRSGGFWDVSSITGRN